MRRRFLVGNHAACRLAHATAFVVALLGCALPQAAGATEWTIKSPASVTVLASNQFNDVWCSTSKACVAVGSYVNSSGVRVGAAQTWDGTAWTIHNPVVPSGAKLAELEGVSCSSSSACTAVGNYTNSSGTVVTLAERWNGTAWSSQTTPNPSGAQSSHLVSVSCASSTSCIAVGRYTNSSGTVVTLGEEWNGMEWVIKTTQNQAEAKSDLLLSVSCTEASACTAVGDLQSSSGVYEPVAERWNGTAWSSQTMKIPTGSVATTVHSVSCTSATACTAVGYFYTATEPQETFAESWNGTAWSLQTTVNSSAKETYLESVSCASSTACTAAGVKVTTAGVDETWAEAWNGTAWKAQTAINPTGTENHLWGVSCTESAACTAVGWYANAGKVTTNQVQRWNGTEWSPQTAAEQTDTATSKLNGVSCTSSMACTAVGWYETSAAIKIPLAEQWNGSVWSKKTIPGEKIEMNGVSCSSSTSCVAAGEFEEEGVADHWNGTEWKQDSPRPPTSEKFWGVSCRTATDCMAVGTVNGKEEDFIADVFKSKEVWEETLPGRLEHYTPYSVSCPSEGSCVAAGAREKTPLVMRPTGEGYTWANESNSVKTPTGAEKSLFEGVSCLVKERSEACEEVGNYYSSSEKIYLTFAERETNEWSIQTTPNPSGAKNSYLRSVSCATETACTAVGDYVNSSGTTVTLAEEWNGTAWKIQTTPNPTGAKESILKSVSCTSSTACVAVGWYVNSEGVTTPLTEVY